MMVPLLNRLIIQATPMTKRLNHVQVSAVADDTEQAPDVERLQFVINMTMENWETWKRYCHPKDFRLKHREPRDHGAPAQVGDTFFTSTHSSLTFGRTFLIRNGSDQGHICGRDVQVNVQALSERHGAGLQRRTRTVVLQFRSSPQSCRAVLLKLWSAEWSGMVVYGFGTSARFG